MALNESYKRWHKPRANHFTEDGTLKKGETHQGYLHEKYQLKFPEKYMGNPQLIIYRSGWELAFCRWCDVSPSILKWSSEPVRIPYYDRVSKLEECKKYGLDPNNPKNWVTKFYNTDFWIMIKKSDDTIEKWFVEIKPSNKLVKPKPPDINATLKEQRRFTIAAKEYLINEAKFTAIQAWSEKNNAKFCIFTEKQLIKFGIIYDNKYPDFNAKSQRRK